MNKNRAKVTKPVLEVGDVGSIKVQGNTKGATDHPWLPIMVTVVRKVSEDSYMYSLCTQHGYLSGEFPRGDIYPNEYMTPKILKIDPTKPGFLNNLSVAKASAHYNVLGGSNFCRCGRECSEANRCSCIALGKLCTKKCHKKRKDDKEVICFNCPPETHEE